MKLKYTVQLNKNESFTVASNDGHDGEMIALVSIKKWIYENSKVNESVTGEISDAIHKLAYTWKGSTIKSNGDTLTFSVKHLCVR